MPERYRGRVRPPNHDWTRVCGAFEEMGEEWKDGFNYAMNVLGFWGGFQMAQRAIDRPHALAGGRDGFFTGMFKSRLLRRLIIGEEIRREPCPVHEGQMVTFDDCEHCDGTGWLPNEGDEMAQARDHGYYDLGPYKVMAVDPSEDEDA